MRKSTAVKYTSIAKISPPLPKDVVLRKRLFQQIDDCRKKPVTWVSGPPGSGKTTLVSNYLHYNKIPCIWYQVDRGDSDISTFFYYMGLAAKKASPHSRKPLPLLTPEYIMGVSTFALRYFEELFSRLRGPFILVLDNYHEVESASPFHEVITKGFSAMPGMINGIVISRKPAPRQFIRLHAYEQMSFISGENLNFTVDESREFFRLKGSRGMSDEALLKIYQETSGWAAGLTLMVETQKRSGVDYHLLDHRSPEKVFAYFAHEIFDKSEETTKTFLLKTAFLLRITSETAKKLTNMADADRTLSDLHENNYFTIRYNVEHPVYQYHPLFRGFLLERAKESLSSEEISEIRKAAASLLETSGQIEYAAELYILEKSWEELVRLILGNANTLISQGRSKTLEDWILSIPERIKAERPWIIYWHGVCKQSYNPPESYSLFEQAFRSFNEQQDVIGSFSSWLGAVNAVFYSQDDCVRLDYWITWLERRLKEDPSFPSFEIETSVVSSMVGALVWRQPYHPEKQKWVEKAWSFCLQSLDVDLSVRSWSQIGIYYGCMGDYIHYRIMANEMRKKLQISTVSPLTALMWKNNEAMLYSNSVKTYEDALQAVLEGLEIATKSGIHMWDAGLFAQGVYASLNLKDIQKVGDYLEKLSSMVDRSRRSFYAQFLFLQTWFNLVQGKISSAYALAEKAVQLTVETGIPIAEIMCRLALAQVLHQGKNDQVAQEQLMIAKGIIKKAGTFYFEYLCLLSEAEFALDRGKENDCLTFLREAMNLGRKQEYLTMVCFWLPSVWTKLCRKALENDIEVQYVQELIRNFHLVPETPLEIENWPYQLKIYTFGRFSVMKEGNPLRFSGKVQQKPLSLLKAILSFGGREVSEEQLSDSLWPDAAGDVAHVSFKTNLHRLRQMIGHEEVIQLKEGRVTLDQRYCWVDVWAFQRAVGKAEKIYKRLEEGESKKKDRDEFEREFVQLSEKAMNLYKGDFLAGDSTKSWTVSMREKLKGKFAQLILKLRQYYEQTGQWENAISCCQKALEIDDLSEEFYQRLMECYQQVGRNVDAIAVYRRCCKTLAAMMGVEPSPETTAIYKRIKEKESSAQGFGRS